MAGPKSQKPSRRLAGVARRAASLLTGTLWPAARGGASAVLRTVRQHPRVVGSVAVAAIITGSMLGALYFVRTRRLDAIERAERDSFSSLELALEALDGRRWSEARRLARLLAKMSVPEPEAGGAEYVLGAAAALEADDADDRHQRSLALLAVRHLERSRQLGFPPGREIDGLWLLGKSLFQSGRPRECREPLEATLDANIESPRRVYTLLAQAFQKEPDRDLETALEYNQFYLEEESTADEERSAGLLDRANILWRLGNDAECVATLNQIPRDALVSPDAALLRGRLMLNDARRMLRAERRAAKSVAKGGPAVNEPSPSNANASPPPNGDPSAISAADSASKPTETRRVGVSDYSLPLREKYDSVLAQLRAAQSDPLRVATVRKAMYLIGVAYLDLGDIRAALRQFERTRSMHPVSHEGRAAGLQEADIYRDQEMVDEAITAYLRVLATVRPSETFANAWIPADKFRGRILAAFESLTAIGDFERAIVLGEKLSPLFPKSRAVELTAETYRAWASRLLLQAESQPEALAGESRRRGRELWRKAGQTYLELAKLNFTAKRYPEDLWLAAESLLAGHQFSRAAESFQRFLDADRVKRRPRALLGLGEAQLSLHQLDAALAAFRECIEFYPNDAATYRARLLAAKARMLRGEAKMAESLLRDNLSGDLLTPASREWRDSLFVLGELLATEGRNEEAIETLEEAIARFPETRQAIEAHYLAAEAYRQAAKIPQAKLEQDSVATAKTLHFRRMQELLGNAITHYEHVQKALNEGLEAGSLGLVEQAMLRNSYFAAGSALFDLTRYEEAIRVYSTATNRYQREPEVLDAFLQIAHCYRKLGKTAEARGALQQALVVLTRMPNESSQAFQETSNLSRQQWTELLQWLAKI